MAASPSTIETRERLAALAGELSGARLEALLAFAEYLASQERLRAESEDWAAFGLQQLARLYGEDEPDYSDHDSVVGH